MKVKLLLRATLVLGLGLLGPPALTAAEDSYLVKLNCKPSDCDALLDTLGLKLKRKFLLDPQLFEVRGTLSDISLLSKDRRVLYAEKSQTLRLIEPVNKVETNSLAPEAYGPRKIKAQAVLDQGIIGSPSIRVAVIDTGVDYNHPALRSKIWVNPREIPGNGVDDDGNGVVDDVHGANFSGAIPTGDPMDDNDHGTHCAGIIAGDEVGIAPGVQIIPIKFINSEGDGSIGAAISAIDYAVSVGAKIISASWGGTTVSTALQNVIGAAGSKGVLFVAAAGNEATNNDSIPTFPASLPLGNVISVAATDQNDRLAQFSNYGTRTVSVAAPGVGIYSTVRGGRYAQLSGTSMSTPLIAGLAALTLSKFPQLTPIGVKQVIIWTSDPLPGIPVVARGRVSAAGVIFNQAELAASAFLVG